MTITTGIDENGRIYADIIRLGRLRARLTSTGERPFIDETEARRYGRAYIKRIAR